MHRIKKNYVGIYIKKSKKIIKFNPISLSNRINFRWSMVAQKIINKQKQSDQMKDYNFLWL